ncbi:MAG: acetyl-CoA carboxylase carboxyltransferase subunit alpha [Planctomycetota bacterium]|jgi:acetyl-CoA carboxylase carboxyl transferase subunit alpha
MPRGTQNSYLEFEKPIIELEKMIEELETFSITTETDLSSQIAELRERCDSLKQDVFSKLTAWQRVQLARHPNRPLTTDYIEFVFSDFLELHGDRRFGDDKAIVTGFARINGTKVMVIGHRKGRSVRDKMTCNFGMAHPEGYRKALHKMQLAEKFNLPIVAFVDTPGAYPGIGAEERGQAHAIAENIREMSRLRVPIVSIVIGEGGSGGALGIGVADRLAIMENAYYSVISPEGCASILWKTSTRAEDAANTLRLTAQDLKEFGIVDDVVPEPLGGAHRDHLGAARNIRAYLESAFADLEGSSGNGLIERRYNRLKSVGRFLEPACVR